jgi:hypothetical protein
MGELPWPAGQSLGGFGLLHDAAFLKGSCIAVNEWFSATTKSTGIACTATTSPLASAQEMKMPIFQPSLSPRRNDTICRSKRQDAKR